MSKKEEKNMTIINWIILIVSIIITLILSNFVLNWLGY
jgi:uncharacterized membrane protein YwzB